MSPSPRFAFAPALVALVTLLAAACAGSTTPSPSASPAPAGLDGRAFLSTQVEGRVLVVGSRIRLSFEGGSLSVQAGCNGMGAAYRIDAGHLVVDGLSSTEMACEQPLMDQDTWIANLLTARPTIDLQDDALVLAGGGVRVTLLDREVADPDRPLAGTRWLLDGIVERDAVSSVPIGVTASITFGPGRVDVEAGCNGGGGPVEVGEGMLAFGPIGLTKMACQGEAMAVERAVTSVLSGEVGYSIEADVLTLDAGGRGLVFRAAG